MNVLMLSKDGDGLSIAHQLVKEGHKVRLFIQNRQYKWVGQGILDRVDSWRPSMDWAELVLGDMVGFGSLEKTMRRFGVPALGFSEIADRLELDRAFGLDTLEAAGAKIPETFRYASPKEAQTHIVDWQEPGFVIKPSGNIETGKTYVCRDPETFAWALETLPNDRLVVQKIVEGTEVSCEGWWNGRDWLDPFNITFEEKRFLERGRGPNTGCQGNLVRSVEGKAKIVQESVALLAPFLRENAYRGPIDLNCIVNDAGVYALEITSRFGYDAFEAVMEMMRGSVLDFLFELAVGVRRDMDIRGNWGAAVRVSVPPWPHSEPAEEDRGKPILGLSEENLKHIYLTDVYKDGDIYRSAAGDGVLLKVVARGQTISQAVGRTARTLGNLSILDAQYRGDIGVRAEADFEKLKQMNYIGETKE